jgi:2-haloalkanoic acid dehalogenase type II
LIDWEAGIRSAFGKAVEQTIAKPEFVERAVQIYEDEERRIEKEHPHESYRSVLSKTAIAVAHEIGWNLKPLDSAFLAEELQNWTPFPDTNPALERLAKHHRLGILSNVDNDLIEGTMKHLNVKFDFLVTAENVRSYKPSFAHFEEARRIIGGKPWAHVAASQYHDIEPSLALGIPAFWVNRKGLRPHHDYSGRDVTVIRDLTGLVSILGS